MESTKIPGLIEYRPGSQMARVDAAAEPVAVQAYLFSQQQCLPFGPFPQGITFAEILDWNLVSFLSGETAGLGQFLLNTTLECGRGAIRTGANTIKNVAGYNLNALVLGAQGSIGKVSEITFRVLPIREKLKTAYAKADLPIKNGFRAALPIGDFHKAAELLAQFDSRCYPALQCIDFDSDLTAEIKTANALQDAKFYKIENYRAYGQQIQNADLQQKIKTIFDSNGQFPQLQTRSF